ncbi:MAG: hypothetical protein ACYC56_02665 [Candidatus Aquicultor sp.]
MVSASKIMVVLIVMAIAFGSIFYLYNDRNYKISQYVLNVAAKLEPMREMRELEAKTKDEQIWYAKNLDKAKFDKLVHAMKYYEKTIAPAVATLSNDFYPFEILSLPQHKRDFILDYLPYVHKVRQRFVIYSTSIAVIAFATSAFVLRSKSEHNAE